MEKELDELSAIQEDKINVIKLIAFNDKEGMNSDILRIIYNYLISAKGIAKYTPYFEELVNNKLLSYTKKKEFYIKIIGI